MRVGDCPLSRITIPIQYPPYNRGRCRKHLGHHPSSCATIFLITNQQHARPAQRREGKTEPLLSIPIIITSSKRKAKPRSDTFKSIVAFTNPHTFHSPCSQLHRQNANGHHLEDERSPLHLFSHKAKQNSKTDHGNFAPIWGCLRLGSGRSRRLQALRHHLPAQA
jgi:hypothetical protein